jgi:hypothetical protein
VKALVELWQLIFPNEKSSTGFCEKSFEKKYFFLLYSASLFKDMWLSCAAYLQYIS